MIRVAGVLIIQDGEYVLQYRDNRPDIAEPDTYSLWGGTLEGQETPEAGALRELLEETTLRAASSDLIALHDYETKGKGPKSFGEPVHAYLFAAVVPSGRIIECREGQGIVRLKPFSGLHPKLNEFAREAIELYETTTR